MSSSLATPPADPPVDEQVQQTDEIYKKALTFNVIAKYDPKINQLIHLSSYGVVYEWNGNDWDKMEYQGPIAIYSRNAIPISEDKTLTVDEILKHDYYQYGLIILNRARPQNFTVGLLGNKHLVAEDKEKGMEAELVEELIMIRNFKGDTFGLWIFDPKDRQYICKFLRYCIDN